MRINAHVGKLKDIIPKKTAALSLTTDEPPTDAEHKQPTSKRISWARLLKRVFDIDNKTVIA